MPIQVVSTYKKIPPPPVTLITAGADVFPLCDLVIFLQAIVDPIANLPGHTITWEQLSGTPVIILNGNTLTPSYAQIVNDETDKEFKVTIDKYLPEEQSDTVIVYATPTSLLTTSYPSESVSRIASDAVACDSIVVSTEAIIPLPAGVINDTVTVTDAFTISWDIPPDPLLQPFLVDMTLFEDGIPVQTYLPTDVLSYLGGPKTYNVFSTFVVNGNPSSEDSCKKDFTQTVLPSTHAVDDMVSNLSFANDDTTIKLFINSVQNITDQLVTPSFVSSSTIVQRYINSYQEVIDSLSTTGFVIGSATTTRLDPGGIGGG